MKTRITLAALTLVLLTLNSQLSTAFAQGSLTPPGAPAPTMKTLTQIEPRTPISSLPITITSPGSYYLTTNLTSSGGNGITVSSGDVTIDLNGFALLGNGTGTPDGIYVSATYTNLVFRNGTIAGWGGHGIDAWSGGYPRNMLFEKLTVSGNGANGIYTEAGSIVRDCMAFGNNEDGFYSSGGEMINCLAYNNFSTGFLVNNCSLHGCSSEFNVNYGFTLNYSQAVDCDSHFNSYYGFDCLGIGNEICRCRISNNGNNGIFCESGSGENVIEDCEVNNNAGFGIYTFGAGPGGSYIARNNFNANGSGGIILNDSNNDIENNHVTTPNGVLGIAISSGSYSNNVVVRNVVAGGGSSANNYGNPGGSDFGPIGTAASLTSPWGNISH